VVHLSNLANGALTTVSESSAGDLAVFSTAVDWQPEVDVATGLGRLFQSAEIAPVQTVRSGRERDGGLLTVELEV
jgi:hypothetical protein